MGDVRVLIDKGRGLVGTPREAGWFDLLDRARVDLNAYLEDALERTDGPTLTSCGAALWPYWIRRADDGDEWLRRLADATADEPPSAELSELRYGAGFAAFHRGDNEASLVLNGQALAIADECGSKRCRALALLGFSRVAFRQGDYDAGRSYATDAGVAATDADDEPLVLLALHTEAEVCRTAGDHASAVPMYLRLIARYRTTGNLRSLAVELGNVGSVYLQMGDLPNAARHLRESLEIAVDSGVRDQVPYSLLGFAGMAARLGQAALAGRLLGAVEAVFEKEGEVPDPAEQRELSTHVAAGCAAGAEAFDDARREGHDLPLSEVIRDIQAARL